MQIIKPIAIIIAVTIAMIGIGQQTVQATSDTFRVQVTLDGVDSLTKRLDVIVEGADGTLVSRTVDPFADGKSGVVTISDFILSEDSTRIGEHYEVCLHAIDYNYESECKLSDRGSANIQKITVDVSSGIGRVGDPNNGITYYDENGNVVEDDGEFVPSTYQGDDSNAVDNNQGTAVSVSIGDNSDNNHITLDQRTHLEMY